MNRYEENHAALVELLDTLDRAQDAKAATVDAIKEFASGMSGNPASVLMHAPRLAPLVAQFISEQSQYEAAVCSALHVVTQAVENAMDEEDEAHGA